MYDPVGEYRPSQSVLRQVDALREYRKMQSVAQMADPLREYRKMQSIAQMADPLREYRKMQSVVQMADPLREYRKMQSVVQMADPLGEYRKMQSVVQMADPLREYRKMQRAIASSSIHQLRGLASIAGVQKMARAFLTHDPFRHTRELLNALSSSANLYRAASGHTFDSISLAVALTNLESTTGFDASASQPANVIESVSEILRALQKGIRTAVVDRLGLDFYLSLLITLLVAIVQTDLSDQSERRIVLEITETREQVLDKFEEGITQAPDLSTYYVVRRAVRLRQSPKGDAAVVGVLYPNQVTRFVGQKGKWIRVEYFDYLSGVHRSGWCYKKYLWRVSSGSPGGV